MLPQTLRDVTAAKAVTDKAASTPAPGALPLADESGGLNKWSSRWIDPSKKVNFGVPSTFIAPGDGFVYMYAVVLPGGNMSASTTGPLTLNAHNAAPVAKWSTFVMPVAKGTAVFMQATSIQEWIVACFFGLTD